MTRHVYVHVPFCARRCSYCDFSIAVRETCRSMSISRALDAELRTRFADVDSRGASTRSTSAAARHRGSAGTASRARIDLVRRAFRPCAADAEVTIEANPEDVDAATLPGVASRRRQSALARRAVASMTTSLEVDAPHARRTRHRVARSNGRATAGITNLSLDLIFALPDALERDFARRSRAAARARAGPRLAVRADGRAEARRSALGRARPNRRTRRKKDTRPSFSLAHELLTAAGFEHYEVSNYALAWPTVAPQLRVLAGVPYVGLGPAAHGFDGGVRRWNARHYADVV